LGGLRIMAVDGTVFDIPDTEANARVFGYPASRPGTRSAFPKVRLVLLIEALRVRGRLRRETLLQRRLTGTHLGSSKYVVIN
jgi:hypothetical protein